MSMFEPQIEGQPLEDQPPFDNFEEASDEDSFEDESERVVEGEQQDAIPSHVKSFIDFFYTSLTEMNLRDIQNLYENQFNKLTERHYKNAFWPSAQTIAPLVNNDSTFLILYKELYYRHIYSKFNPTLEQRFESWQNYFDLFNLLINSGRQLQLELPERWLWDIIDEFIYQLQAYCTYRAKLKGTEDEVAVIKQNPQVWNVTTVIITLNKLVTKSNIVAYLERDRKAEPHPADDISSHNVYRMLGYFSLVGLLRVHCLLGDYWLALKTIESLDFGRKGLSAKVPACQISLYYYAGFCYLMMRRYIDAIKTLSNVLLYIIRTNQIQYRGYQRDQVVKKNEQMFELLAIVLALCPQRIDETLHNSLRENYSEKQQRLTKGEDSLPAFEDLFVRCCPKFISPHPHNFDDPNVNDAVKVQLKHFMVEVSQQVKESQLLTIRSFLKLYTTIPISKLAAFLNVDDDTFRTDLLSYKHKTHNLVWQGSGPTLSGKITSSSDIDYYVDGDMVHIADTKITRRYGEYFIRHILKFEETIKNLENKK